MTVVPLDPQHVRGHFPSLTREFAGRPVVYADGPGGTQVPAVVPAAMAAYLATSNANFGGRFITSRETNALVADVRTGVAHLLNAASPDEIVFGQNMTSLTFAMSRAVARTWQPGDEVIVSALDHDANVQPWRLAAEERGAVVRLLPCERGDLGLSVERLVGLLSPRTRLVALTCASNAVGTLVDLPPLIHAAHAVGALCYLDAVHYAPHGVIDVQALDCDFLACSAYKFSGPHLGILYGRHALLESLTAYKVRPSSSVSPGKWETGTQNTEALSGLHACLGYFAALGHDATLGDGTDALPSRAALSHAQARIHAHELELTRRFLTGVAAIPALTVHGIANPAHAALRTPTFGLTCATASPRRLCEGLAARGVFAWDGHFYAQELIAQLGLAEAGGLLRIGFAHYTTSDEVDRVLDALRELT